ncbi:hypothetical protein Bca4012_084142 [Brassica carinata]
METKNQDEALFRLFKNSELTNHFTVPPIGLAGGLSLSWKDDIQVEILYSSPNVIDTRIEALGSFSFVSFIYGAPNPADRPVFWSKLTELGAEREEAWLLTGDFNDLLDNSEKVGGPARWEGSFLSFRSFVSQMGLWDLQHSGNHLSWRGTRYNHFIQSRLDRAMANYSWFECFPAGRCEYLRFEGSDHRPIVVYFDVSTRKKKGLFRFDRRLKNKSEIRELVDTEWKKEPFDSVLTRIGNIRHDAAWDAATGNCGISWLLRDADNTIAESSSSHRRFIPSALVAEALAVMAVISAALSFHVSSIRVCSDSKTLITLLKTHGQDIALKGVLHDIRLLARSFSSISFIHVPRLANVEADSIAKAALASLCSSATL